MAVLTIWWRIFQRILASCQKSEFKCERGNDEEGKLDPSEPCSYSTGIPRWGSQSLKIPPKVPFLTPDPLNQWSGPESIARVWIDGEDAWALLDSGSTINAVTLECVDVCSLDVGPLSNLSDGTLGINGFSRVFSWPLGYVIIRVQKEGVKGYDEDQVALVIPDSTGFGSWIPVTLGTPTINQIINMIKESEIDELLVSLNGSRIAWLLACWQAELVIWKETVANQAVDPNNLNEAVKTTEKKEVAAFCPK